MQVQLFRIRLQEIISTYSFLFRESCNFLRWRLLLPIFALATGIVLQIAAIAVIFLYAKRLVDGHVISFFSFQFPPQHSVTLLSLVTAVSFLLLTVAAALTYFGNLSAVKMSCAFERYCIEKLTSVLARSKAPRIPIADINQEESVLIRSAMNDTRACGRAFLLGLTNVVPLLTFVASIIALATTNWMVTIALIPLFLFYLIFLYRVNLQGVKASRNLEQFGSVVRKDFHGFLQSIRDRTQTIGSENFWQNENQNKNVSKYLSAYGTVIGLSHRSSFVNDFFVALAITSVLFGLAATSIIAQSKWTVLAIYIVALRYALSSLKQATNRLTLLNRFHPQVSRLFRLIYSVDLRRIINTPDKTIQVNVNSTSPFSPQKLDVHRGQLAVLYSERGVTRFNAQSTVDSLLGLQKPQINEHSVSIVSSSNTSLQFDNLDSGVPFLSRVLKEVSSGQGISVDLVNLFPEHAVISSELLALGEQSNTRQELSKESALYLSLVEAITSRATWVFIRAQDLPFLNREAWQRVLSYFQDSFVFVFRRDFSLIKSTELPLQIRTSVILMPDLFNIAWVGTQEEFQNKQASLLPIYKPLHGVFSEEDSETLEEELDAGEL